MLAALRRRCRLVILSGALAGVTLLAVFPVNATVAQRRHDAELRAELARLTAERAALEGRVEALQTDAEIERLARLEHQLVKPGEEAYAILPSPPPSRPTGPG